mmetsp:Transcript_17251/g.32168  ORF Transcript_17251/g.32168 Transcript_17251/m.32168 type:complete len:81 (-) Transcript_17251:390-632(-)
MMEEPDDEVESDMSVESSDDTEPESELVAKLSESEIRKGEDNRDIVKLDDLVALVLFRTVFFDSLLLLSVLGQEKHAPWR